MSYTRFAVYYLPPEGALAEFGARWLGWDVARGAAVPGFDLPSRAALVEKPRKYGFHGTLKPPFRLAEGHAPAQLEREVAALAERLAPAQSAGLRLARLGRFLALVPEGGAAGIGEIAAHCVSALDGFRAAPGEGELARRRAAGLSAAQEALLMRWGYPYVMEEFRFHLTLTGPLPEAPGAAERWEAALRARLPALPAPFVLREIALVGEREDGHFQLIRRFALRG